MEDMTTNIKTDAKLRDLLSMTSRKDHAGPCPDTDTLAAFLDHTLSESEHAAVEAHLSQCDQCLESLVTVHMATDAPDSELGAGELQPVFDLVPPKPVITGRITETVVDFFWSFSVSAPVAAICLLLVCGTAFYAGMQTWVRQNLVTTALAHELTFSMELSVPYASIPEKSHEN